RLGAEMTQAARPSASVSASISAHRNKQTDDPIEWATSDPDNVALTPGTSQLLVFAVFHRKTPIAPLVGLWWPNEGSIALSPHLGGDIRQAHCLGWLDARSAVKGLLKSVDLSAQWSALKELNPGLQLAGCGSSIELCPQERHDIDGNKVQCNHQ